MLKVNINLSETLQAIIPMRIIQDLMDLVFDIEKVVLLFFLFVLTSTILFIFLIFSLIYQIRNKEINMIRMIGGSKGSIFFLMGIALWIDKRRETLYVKSEILKEI